MNIQLLDDLADAFESKGHIVRETLFPGIERPEISAIYPDVDLCEEIFQLYGWHNGGKGGLNLDSIMFRDTGYLPLQEAKDYASELIRLYVHPDGLDQTDGKFEYPDFDKWVAVSGFEGMVYVVICGKHIFNDKLKNPVLCIGCGAFYIAYDSIESMLHTCIAWVQHESWAPYETMPEEVERSIWRKHNPICFS